VIILLTAVAIGQRVFSSRRGVSADEPTGRIAEVAKVAIEDPESAGAELSRVTSDASPPVRAAAVAGLAHVGTPEQRRVVVKATEAPDARTRAVAAGTLSTLADKEAVDVLVKLVETDPDDEVVCAALRGLGRCGKDPRSRVTLMETAEKGRSNAIKKAAMNGLLRMVDGRIATSRDPSNEKSWRDLVQRWKENWRVREAYKVTGTPQVLRPEDKIGKDENRPPEEWFKHLRQEER
jgi:HEAT repeat protein